MRNTSSSTLAGLDPAFLFPDGLTLRDVENGAREPLSEAKRHRLVKASKCPTAIKPANWGHRTPGPSTQSEIAAPAIPRTAEGQRGAYAVIQFREWSDEYRIRTRVETTSGTTPPENVGPRITAMLTQRAARKVAESCAYVSAKKGGYRTFFTLTFDAEHRAAIDAGDTTIQREVSRFMDGLQKMWRRGWRAEFENHGRKMACVDRDGQPMGQPGILPCVNPDCKRCEGYTATQRKARDICSKCDPHELRYVWVAECPENANGDPNPHVHVLINWRVKYALFPSWAKRIESLWGQGIAHIEKIKDTDAAAAYMMKAAGYLCKAQDKTDQGEIRGNRYGISAAARAPDWETLAESQLHIMGRLIADVHDHLTEKHGQQYHQRRHLAEQLDKAGKGTKVRHAIGRKLQQVRAELAKIPVVASKYQVILKGGIAFWQFYQWATATKQEAAPGWLPAKGRGEEYRPGSRPDSQWYGEFKRRHYWRRALRKIPTFSDFEFQQCTDEYQQWAELAAA